MASNVGARDNNSPEARGGRDVREVGASQPRDPAALLVYHHKQRP